MNYSTVILIAGMALVTYLPRVLPSVIIDKLTIPPKAEKFLRMIPYTAMAALIFPGILTVDRLHPAVGIVGSAAAAILVWKKAPVIFCAAAAIIADMVLYAVCYI